MYCQNCGNELRQNLAFCNRCGARVNLDIERFQDADLPIKKAAIVRNLSIAIGLIGVSGIMAVAGLIYELIKRNDIPPRAFLLIMIFSALIFGIVFLITSQISRFSLIYSPNSLLQSDPRELPRDKENNQLPGHFQTVPNSVTEYTTRNLEHIKRENY